MSTILMIVFSFFALNGFSCKSFSFKQSSLETREETSVSSYALCMRVMADGNSSVAGKNVSFCDSLKNHTILEEEYNICVDALNNKPACYTEIWKRHNLKD